MNKTNRLQEGDFITVSVVVINAVTREHQNVSNSSAIVVKRRNIQWLWMVLKNLNRKLDSFETPKSNLAKLMITNSKMQCSVLEY